VLRGITETPILTQREQQLTVSPRSRSASTVSSRRSRVLASVKGTNDAFGEIARSGRGTQHDLEATLRDVSEAAEAIRMLAESLDRDPDMLLKGKTKVKATR
jgi:hypothetical protein